MGNCLTTQYKERANNNNLPVYKAIRINVNHSVADGVSQSDRYLTITGNLTLINKGGYFCDINGENLVTEKTISGQTAIFYTAQTNQIIVKNKEDIVFLSLFSSSNNINALNVELDDAEYMDSLTTVVLGGKAQKGSLSKFKKDENVTILNLNGTSIAGNIEDVRDLALTSLVTYGSDITGSVEVLIRKSDGTLRPAGTLSINVSANQIQYNGSYLSAGVHSVVFDGEGGITVS